MVFIFKKTNVPLDEYYNTIETFNKLGCTNILEYSNYYLLNDVEMLLEIVYNFRDSSISNYNIDPLHYVSLPAYAWDVALSNLEIIDHNGDYECDFYKYTKHIELLTNKKMINSFIKNIRGGISSLSERPWIKDDGENTIMYWDANNLYGWAMSQNLPYGGYKYIDQFEFENYHVDFILNYDIDNSCDENNISWGYIYDVDIDYPKELHELHNEMPFFPERLSERLCFSLFNKKDYLTHIMNLKLALQNGLILKKINSIIKFKQYPWLSSYIEGNTEKEEILVMNLKEIFTS